MGKYIDRPKQVVAFAEDAQQGDYLTVHFGTNIVSRKLDDIGNKNYKYGLESLEKDLQLKDLNTALYYSGSLVKYLFERGVPEYSPYESYPSGAVVSHDNAVWVATKEIRPAKEKPVPMSSVMECKPIPVCVPPDSYEPSKENGWCKLVNHCEYDLDKQSTDSQLQALDQAIKDLRGVVRFYVRDNGNGGKELVLVLDDGGEEIIDMSKFGGITKNADDSYTIKNPDGSTLELPKFVKSSEIDDTRGFNWNRNTGKWEVDLADLIKPDSGIKLDSNGVASLDNNYVQDMIDRSVSSGGNEVKDELNGKINNEINTVKEELNRVKDSIPQAGDGISLVDGKFKVNVVRIVDASGKHTLGYGVKV